MLHLIGYALMFMLVMSILFVLAVFQAAAVEVRKKPRLALVTADAPPQPPDRDEAQEPTRAA
jgi:hypothetical protein